MLYLASDHAGFTLKTAIIAALKKNDVPHDDLGCYSEISCDYSDFAHKLADQVQKSGAMGIAICGSGIGMSMALNRHAEIRAALCHEENSVELSRKHNDANVLVLAGRKTTLEQALSFLKIFSETQFEGGRHLARVKKIEIT